MPDTTTRRGDWMQVASGGAFYPLDPRPEEIHIEDIAHSLAHLCRFGGHTSRFYSVAEHSVYVSLLASVDGEGLWGLLHDASESYLGDLIRPLKRQPELAPYVEAEERLMGVICARFGLPAAMPPSVAHADEVMLATEARDLLGNAALERWSSIRDVVPLPEMVRGWGPEEARERFLARFWEVTP